jgi:hypothetical protein
MSISTFFEKIGHDLKEIFTSTTWEQKTLAAIAYSEPFLVGMLDLVDPTIAPLVSSVLAAVTSDLGTVKNVVSQGTVAPGSSAATEVVSALNSVKSNLSSLLTDADVKNSANVAKITAAVNLVNGEVDAILDEAPSPAPSSVST